MKQNLKRILSVFLLLSLLGCQKNPSTPMYTITFYDFSHEPFFVKEVEPGVYPLSEEPYALEGYLFEGWLYQGALVNEVLVDQDIELYPSFVPDNGAVSSQDYDGEYLIWTNEIEQFFEVGESGLVRYEISPESYQGPIHFHCSDPSVLELHEDGSCTALAVGATVVTVSIDHAAVQFTVEVHDTSQSPDAPKKDISDSFKFESDEFVHLAIGETSSIRISVTSENKDTRTLQYTSDDPSVATVNDSGVIRAKGYGSTVIRAGTKDNKYSVLVFVYVNGATLRVHVPNPEYRYHIGDLLDVYLDYTTYKDGRVSTVNGWGEKNLKFVVEEGPDVFESLDSSIKVASSYSGIIRGHFEIGTAKSETIVLHISE